MTNDENNMNEENRMTPAIAACWSFGFRHLGFGFHSSFVIRHSSFVLIWALLPICSACRRDMFDQPFSKPLEQSDFFQDNHMASRPLVLFTVARGHLNEDEAFFTGKIGTNLVMEFPFPVTRQ